ncbi:hypothetical protein LLT5_07255 [Lactococcus cremoris subsp. cremoris TIFN5]|jgi:hypothetical protein|nr:hypothetical protein LLNZ_05530 [Lactococcus cremoris subsp. cremoris NZ9000]EQC56570.1 hypothetical protein LLT5_07255 [Lactococcus cremoris subsp. cremoris TIFN5]
MPKPVSNSDILRDFKSLLLRQVSTTTYLTKSLGRQIAISEQKSGTHGAV